MEDSSRELLLQPGEADVARGLRALNVAQDYFEVIAAQHPDFLGGTVGTVTLTNNQEWTAFPAGLLRIDRLQFINPDNSLPAWDLVNLRRTGSHAFRRMWPWNLVSTVTSGRPRGYWTNGTRIYWDPRPNSSTETVRFYGLQAAADITAGGTFAYADAVMFPLAVFAVKVIRTGIDDDPSDLTALARELFEPLIATLSNFNRDGARPFDYSHGHIT